MHGSTNAMGLLDYSFYLGVMAKLSINTTAFFFARELTEAQIADLPAEVSEKNRLEVEQTLTSNLYLCLGERGQDELHNRKSHLDLVATRYRRVLDELESVFRKETKRSRHFNYYPESNGRGRHWKCFTRF